MVVERQSPLPIAVQPSPSTVRAMAIGALEAASIPWAETFVGGGVATISAAVATGLAVAALAHRGAPAGDVDVGEQVAPSATAEPGACAVFRFVGSRFPNMPSSDWGKLMREWPALCPARFRRWGAERTNHPVEGRSVPNG